MTPFALKLNGTKLQLTLVGEITIEHVHLLAIELKNTLSAELTLEIDASQLIRLDAAGLQVLLASAQLAADSSLCATSQAWKDAFTRYASPDPFHIT